MNNREIGNLVKEARRLKGEKIGKRFSQKNLADAVGRSRTYITDIETGRCSVNKNLLKEIALACDVPLNFFESDLIHTHEIKTVKDAVKFILAHQCINGLNLEEMTESDVIEFSNDLLKQIELLSYKYKK